MDWAFSMWGSNCSKSVDIWCFLAQLRGKVLIVQILSTKLLKLGLQQLPIHFLCGGLSCHKVFYCAYNQTNKVLKNCYIPSLRSLNSLQMFYSLRSLQKCAYLQIPQFRMQALFSIRGKCKNPAITISRHFGISQTIFSIQTQTTLEKQKLIVWQFERGSSTKRGWWKHCWGEESPRDGGKPSQILQPISGKSVGESD